MKIEQSSAERIRAALRSQEKKIREILDALELNDAGADAVLAQIRLIEDGFRRLRLAA